MSGGPGRDAASRAREEPFLSRWKAYLDERFPPGKYGLLIVATYSSNSFLAHVLAAPGDPMRYDLHSLLGALTLLCVFFHLRVFDEHKDHEDDVRHFPDRVLSRGLVTLRHLKIAGGAAIAIELAAGALAGPEALAAVAIVLAFSLLMLKEFFVRELLRRHFVTYAVSHMLILPLMSVMVYSFALGRFPWTAPRWFWLYSSVSFFVTFNWEISRKIRAPEQEIEGVDSYTRRFGLYGAAWLVLGARVVDTALVAVVGAHVGVARWFYGALVVLFAVCLVGFLQFRLRTSPRTASRMETYAGIYIVAFDLILAAALIQRNGLVLS